MKNERTIQFCTCENKVALEDYYLSLCKMLDSVNESADTEITTDIA